MPIQLPDLPYPDNALEPYISARTLAYHYGKHHKAYVDKVYSAIENTAQAEDTLEQIILNARNAGDEQLFNNAAQAWNHTFLWNSMAPSGGGRAEGPLGRLIDDAFGSYSEFRKEFAAAATGLFGSGWTWLIQDEKGLRVTNTSNADTPIAHGARPLLTLDVWEHAYYLDYQNGRADYVNAYLDHLVNWEFAQSNLQFAVAAA